jgi:hypothetical protein
LKGLSVEPQDEVFPVNEMVARLIKALQSSSDGESAPNTGDTELRREFAELRKHLTYPAHQGPLPLYREWIRPLGFEASILLAYIIELNRHCLADDKTWDGYFELDEDQIKLELCIDKTRLRNIMDRLRDHFIVRTRETTDRKGNPITLCRLNPLRVITDLKRRGCAVPSGGKNEGYKNRNPRSSSCMASKRTAGNRRFRSAAV